MTKGKKTTMFRSLFLFGAAIPVLSAANTATGPATFHKDVLPVLQRNCQECHRPGEAAPMSFMSFQEARPWAKAIKQAVLKGAMPPWFADPKHGRFANERRLNQSEIAALVSWADHGAPEGDRKQAPPPKHFVEGWAIGNPDRVISMPAAFPVPATGTIEYQYVILPTGLTEDVWVEQAEVRPGDRAINHHVIAFIRPPGSPWFRDQKPGEIFVPRKAERSAGRRAAEKTAEKKDESESGPADGMVELLVGYAPGLQAVRAPEGSAKLLKAGSDIVLQLHYTTNGKKSQDLSRVGLVFAKQTPKLRHVTLNATNNRFVIPANAEAHEVKSSVTFQESADLIHMMPHMHLRGKDFQYTAVYPTGEREVLLSVPRYDFNWQLGYLLEKAKTLPKGTRIECVAHFDNSRNNPANPDPSKEVRWGDQSWEEMMIGWFDVAIAPDRDPMDLFRVKQTAATTKPAE
jgi:mono/diheme cytochrome c family protein